MKKNTGLSGDAKFLWVKKLFRIMKLTTILILISMVSVFASKTYSQSKMLNLNMKNVTVKEVLSKIEDQSEFHFMYSGKVIDVNREVVINTENAKIEDVLKSLFAGTDVNFTIKDRIIVLSVDDSELSFSQQQKSISGKVTDSTGGSLPGVSVIVKGTTNGTITDANGKYSLSNIPANGTLQFSFVGMKTQEIAVGNKTTINVTLTEETIGIDEVVAVGYGVQRRADLTGAVSSVTSKSLDKIVSSNLNQALQGQVAGVNVQQRTGNPGQNASIRIRGANSLTPGVNDPLYVVDGMILTGIGLDINLTDVQSIDILKDASSTAIYGSRGANGVVIITTKRGISGKAQISYDGYSGLQGPIKKLDFLDANEYKKYYQQSRQNATISKTLDPAIINSTTNTDWQDQIFRSAPVQSHALSIQGGTDQSRYYVSLNYFKQDGIIRNSDFSRLSLRYNGDQILSKKIKINQSIILSNTVRNGASDYETVVNGAAWAIPTIPVLDPSGMPTVVNFPFQRTNPRSLVDLIANKTSGYRMIGNAVLNYEIVKGLSLVINGGAEVNISNANSYTPSNLRESSFKGSASKSYSSSWSLINENTLNYSRDIGKYHKINALAGISFQDNKVDGLNGNSIGYVIDGFQYNNLGAGSIQTTGSSFAEYSLLSYLGRINYSYKGKWLLTCAGRYDGSSRLAKGRKYNFFPSAAIAWRISEENFLKGNNTLSDLKLRGSWGVSGSQAVSPYSSFATMSTTNVYLTGSTLPNIGFAPATVANPLLTWETTAQINAGFDLGLFNNRIQITSDIYIKNTTGLLFKRLVPPTSGFLDVIQNVGEIENKGFEFFLKSNNLVGTLKWNTSFNLSLNRAKTIDLGKNSNGDAITMLTASTLGNWFPIILNETPYNPYGYTVEGLDKTTGKIIFKDISNDGKIDAKDQGIIGNFQPKFIFGLMNEFSFKNFDLSIFLQSSVGNEVFSDAVGNQLLLNGNSKITHFVYDKIGTIYPIPNADYGTTGPFGGNLNNYEVFNGTYVRVKNITLGYTLPNSLVNRMRLSDLRIYVTGTNLFTFDKNYPYYDPEASAGPDIIAGWDRGGYVNNKSVIVGLKVSF